MKKLSAVMYYIGKDDNYDEYPPAVRKIHDAMENVNNRIVAYMVTNSHSLPNTAEELEESVRRFFMYERVYDCVVITSVVKKLVGDDEDKIRQLLLNANFKSIDNYVNPDGEFPDDEEMFMYCGINSTGKYLYDNINHYMLRYRK